MLEYKNEVFELASKTFSSKVKDSEMNKLDELINTRVSEGWELAFQSIALNNSLSNHYVLLTFKKEKN